MKAYLGAAVFALPVVAAVAAACLSGCASISEKFAETASQMPVIGVPEGAPQRPVRAGSISLRP
jgi:hypothetical protein